MKDRLIVTRRDPTGTNAPAESPQSTLTKVTGFCTPPMPSAAKKATPASSTQHLKCNHLALYASLYEIKKETTCERESGPRYVSRYH